MNKKKILLISSMLLTSILITTIILNNTNNNENNIISNLNKDNQVINNNMLTLMYETESGSGEYVETKDTTWPESGYIFNDILSGCENGGELEYNLQNNTVNLLSNSSDRCYVYFDKYDGVWIDNVNITNVTGSSVTLDVSATSENGSITTYYFALNDSEEYTEVGSNVITINDLNKLTEYKISIYAVDSTNAKSNIYEINVNTTDESIPIINSVEVSNITYQGFTLTVNATSEFEINKYYYVIESENLAGLSSLNTYTFTNLKSETNYNVIVYAKDVNGNLSNEYILNVSTENGMIFADYILNNIYTGTDSGNYIYYHDGQGTYTNANQEAGDNSYRYSGANPNNYVCFGSQSASCPIDNLYRIIGVFDEDSDGIYKVKLIKSEYAGTDLLGINGDFSRESYNSLYSDYQYYKGNKSLESISIYFWNNKDSTASWETSELNLINLNTNYFNSLEEKWQNMIATTKWKVNVINSSKTTTKEYFRYEKGDLSTNEIYESKIALLYASDMGYSASPENWTTNLGNYYNDTNRNNNWLFMGLYEGTITILDPRYKQHIIYISHNGNLGGYATSVATRIAVRPVFYLNSDVEYISGTGTQSDPFRIQ